MRTDFVVVNRSPDPVIISLQINAGPYNRYITDDVLAKQTLSDSEYKHENWKALVPGEYNTDEENNRITISLNSQEALRVESITNYVENRSSSDEGFRIRGIKITGSKGEVSHTGEQARIQFSKANRGHREIVYE
jgi:hypothetical protein